MFDVRILVVHLYLYSDSGPLSRWTSVRPTWCRVVVSNEDGGFWKCEGFLSSQLRATLRCNLDEIERLRGASFIIMQMAENVLLGHEPIFQSASLGSGFVCSNGSRWRNARFSPLGQDMDPRFVESVAPRMGRLAQHRAAEGRRCGHDRRGSPGGPR